MSEHKARVEWRQEGNDFSYEKYNRNHVVTFAGGGTLQSSAAPDFFGDAQKANPEEMLAAALASCHMLTFLAIASKSNIIVESYSDDAVATLGKNSNGKLAVTKIMLKPIVKVSEKTPVPLEKMKHLHEKAHLNCFVANALGCEMQIDIA